MIAITVPGSEVRQLASELRVQHRSQSEDEHEPYAIEASDVQGHCPCGSCKRVWTVEVHDRGVKRGTRTMRSERERELELVNPQQAVLLRHFKVHLFPFKIVSF